MSTTVELTGKPAYYPRTYTEADFSQEEISVLEQIREHVTAKPTLESVMEFLFEEIRTITPCDRLAVSFLEEDGMYLTVYCVQANYTPIYLNKDYSEDIHRGSLWQVIQKGTPRVIDDLEEYGRLHPDSKSTRLILAEGIRSSMTCPLTLDGRNVGVLFYASRDVAAYEDRHVRLHTALTERLSQVVEKVYRIGQLERAKQVYGEMLSFVSHELKNPLASILSIAGLLKDGFIGELSEEQAAEVAKIMDRGDYMMGLIREHLELARLGEQNLQANVRNGVDFRELVVNPAVDLLQAQISAKGMRVELASAEGVERISCDPELIKIVVVNLLSNAVKYGNPYSAIRVIWGSDGDDWVVSVINDGPGFAESHIPLLFRKFSRLNIPGLSQQSGTGIGLYSSWKIITLHGGKIWAKSKQGSWAEFGFSIPKNISEENPHPPIPHQS